MKHLKLLIVLFALATALPMGYVVLRTYQGIAQEETARMRFFAETLFDTIESELAGRVEIEENRPVDAYHHTETLPADQGGAQRISSLAAPPEAPYILGYLQNNPDGTFQAPIVADAQNIPPGVQKIVQQLDAINRQFNRKKAAIPMARPTTPTVTPVWKKAELPKEAEEKSAFAGKFLDLSRKRAPDDYLGRKPQRTEEISAQQALNVARQDENKTGQNDSLTASGDITQNLEAPSYQNRPAASVPARSSLGESSILRETDGAAAAEMPPSRFQVEVAPLQSVFIDADRIFIFRRIVIDERIYRQGFILKVNAFLTYLAGSYFATQPMSRFAQLRLEVNDMDHPATINQTGANVHQAKFALDRSFPAPFNFLQARLTSEKIPPAASRQTLNIMVAILVAVFLLGLGAIYRSAHAMVDLSERRGRFVSSVTHELKTPLTNIRMYIEMLEQGIARDTAREQDYLRVVGSESARLSRLINNVLELSRLEKKQRHFDMCKGDFQDVLDEVQAVMTEKVRQEDFTLTMAPSKGIEFVYDREVMVQILINLIENSIKFGRQSAIRHITIDVTKHDHHVDVTVADTGPGIPRHALKKVFDDFYRVEDALTRTTGGTGIGLSLVKKFMQAMGGSVTAANNAGPGCTITLHLPKF
ncbi:MAG: HAMP domain-containing histidine kinase [Desulfobacteraceae bacterium]|nr:HAMP domain-containing histidine kinase [Desulfobacteraceae bacterium]MBC2753800.1 HAMP domain-containing histidine kinase [Desulfobacteraceae bacterium]